MSTKTSASSKVKSVTKVCAKPVKSASKAAGKSFGKQPFASKLKIIFGIMLAVGLVMMGLHFPEEITYPLMKIALGGFLSVWIGRKVIKYLASLFK